MVKKIIYIVIAIVVVCAGIVIGKNILQEENTVETFKGYNNAVNENKVENIIKNEIVNKVEKEIGNNNENINVENNITEDIHEDNKEGSTEETDKEKAINIAKKDWGTDASVYFDFDHIDSNGNYIISVRDKSTKAIFWYTVDIEKGEIID